MSVEYSLLDGPGRFTNEQPREGQCMVPLQRKGLGLVVKKRNFLPVPGFYLVVI